MAPGRSGTAEPDLACRKDCSELGSGPCKGSGPQVQADMVVPSWRWMHGTHCLSVVGDPWSERLQRSGCARRGTHGEGVRASGFVQL